MFLRKKKKRFMKLFFFIIIIIIIIIGNLQCFCCYYFYFASASISKLLIFQIHCYSCCFHFFFNVIATGVFSVLSWKIHWENVDNKSKHISNLKRGPKVNKCINVAFFPIFFCAILIDFTDYRKHKSYFVKLWIKYVNVPFKRNIYKIKFGTEIAKHYVFIAHFNKISFCRTFFKIF